jgi:RNA polymerase sigma-70 factor (ECF subfamily)
MIRNRDTFLDLLEQNQDVIHKICNVYTRTGSDREDLFQEIVYQLWKSFPTFRGESSFSTWMYRVALNTALYAMRKFKTRHTIELNENMSEARGVPEPEKENDAISILYEAIETLNGIDRAIILLYLEKKSYDEMARITGLTAKNVGVRLVRIRSKLEKHINSKSVGS